MTRPHLKVLPGGKAPTVDLRLPQQQAPVPADVWHPSRFAALTFAQLVECAQTFKRNDDGSWTVTFAPAAALAIRALLVGKGVRS